MLHENNGKIGCPPHDLMTLVNISPSFTLRAFTAVHPSTVMPYWTNRSESVSLPLVKQAAYSAVKQLSYNN